MYTNTKQLESFDSEDEAYSCERDEDTDIDSEQKAGKRDRS